MKRALIIALILILSVSSISAFEKDQKYMPKVEMIDNSDVFKRYLPFLEDIKFPVKSYQYAPFVGTKSEFMTNMSMNRLRTSFNKSVGIEVPKFVVKVGYDYMFKVIETGWGNKRYYARVGLGFRF